ncbi:unnamed protein product [Rotaria sp. Silwood2]|nr:unnamed protein product [Rotaria sp. Silwood2]CAF4063710.1 unnamed protein product [Rotaria sp. Silwood2]CAF4376922.1 unnamed protein product [Rotaria sp. Silwood2]
MKIDPKEYITLSSEVLDSLIDEGGFYELSVKENLDSFDITNLLNNYNDVNEDMINVIKNNFDHLKSIKNILEDQIQNTFNQLLIDLFSQFNNSTSLKYLNTCKRNYLKGKAPDCSFIYKNVNIYPDDEHESLQHFVVCVGELKSSIKSIDAPKAVGQLLRYMTYILQIQQRGKAYGFITNINSIRFYCAKQENDTSIVYYQSEHFQMFYGLPKASSSSSSSFVNQINTSAPTRYFNEKTLKIFIKFLTMDTNFYGYTTLNINTDDYLYDDIFHIKMGLGNGATSFVYLLANNDKLINNPICSIIKISKHDKYSKYFINEVKILEKLKTSNSNKFDLFFENIFSYSPTGKICLLKKNF